MRCPGVCPTHLPRDSCSLLTIKYRFCFFWKVPCKHSKNGIINDLFVSFQLFKLSFSLFPLRTNSGKLNYTSLRTETESESTAVKCKKQNLFPNVTPLSSEKMQSGYIIFSQTVTKYLVLKHTNILERYFPYYDLIRHI